MESKMAFMGRLCLPGSILHFLKIILTSILLAILLWSLTEASAQSEQSVASLPELKIGDKIPEEIWTLPLTVVNYPDGEKTITLNDYKGKLIVFELWATWCGPCVTTLPHVLDLQEHFKDEMVVLPVTAENRNLIASILKNSPSKGIEALRKRSFTTLVGDSVLYALFPTGSLPHTVVLGKDGRVKAITLPEYLNEETIQELLGGETPYIPQKVKKVTQLPPLLTFSLGGIQTYKPIYYSTIMGELDGVTGRMTNYQVDSANNRIRYIARNNPILLHYAFSGWNMAAMPSRRILEVSDPSKYTYYYDEVTGKGISYNLEWRRESRYTYEAVLPLSFTKESLFLKMREDLNNFFNVKARIEKREVECWVLKRFGDAKPSFISSGKGESLSVVNGSLYRRLKGDTLLGPADSGALTYVRNEKMNLFVINCLRHMDVFYGKRKQFAVPPIIDETGYTGKVDIDLPEKYTNLEDLRNILRPQGLDLVPEVREIEMFVITEPGNETSDSNELRLTKFGFVPARNL
ncbi:AhpC/TSA family protein [Anseongella ginsenosidimutans]|uniref:AhpC/TSA family protein n=1 Tax=Anseongella ginsenosidimutans TaxID=496056 RepID=A0A4R3KRC4_9SPHI|nr:TlpA disulfide reductase family protein [Anseongella ginsenosidimutans]QEC52890.1 TlpA family protein disulfide reductase [Anseongella ginsenosidimutans]TCS87281.1 AhpC/TSA family protein [Anseongella ginsenosidimutans]